MRWFTGLLWRAFVFWALWGAAMFGALWLFRTESLSGDAWGWIGRATLFASAAVLAFAEWSRLNRGSLTLEATLREAGREVPRRWEMATHGCLVILFAAGFWALALTVSSRVLHSASDGANALWILGIGSAAWTVVSLTVLTLIIGGFTRLRLSVAARGLSYPELPVTMPWVVGGWCSMTLLLSFFGLPDPRLIAAIGTMAEVAGTPSTPGGAVELLVELGPDDDINELAGVLQQTGAQVERAVPGATAQEDLTLASTWVVSVPADQAAALALVLELDDEDVSSVELNAAVSADPMATLGSCQRGAALMPVNDPYASGQLELVHIAANDVLGALPLWPLVRPILVAVVDTGVNGEHEDLRAVMVPRAINDDRRGHGTGVASLIGAVSDNRRGMASLNWKGLYLRLLSLPALERPNPAADDVADAIEDALDSGAAVINLSFGARGSAPRVVSAALDRALRQGVAVVAAAGNHDPTLPAGRASDQWPSNVPGVLVVGASAASGLGRAAISNLTDGVGLAISAPGEAVCAASLEGGYQRMSGTSMSAATVSGAVGVMVALCPTLRPTEAVALLVKTATPMPGSGIGPRMDVARALVAAAQIHPGCGARQGLATPSWAAPITEGGSPDTGD